MRSYADPSGSRPTSDFVHATSSPKEVRQRAKREANKRCRLRTCIASILHLEATEEIGKNENASETCHGAHGYAPA